MQTELTKYERWSRSNRYTAAPWPVSQGVGIRPAAPGPGGGSDPDPPAPTTDMAGSGRAQVSREGRGVGDGVCPDGVDSADPGSGTQKGDRR